MSDKIHPALIREAGSDLSDVDKKALSVHSVMIEQGYEPCNSNHEPLKTQRLQDGWKGNGLFTFYYRHPKSAHQFEAKIVQIGDKLVTLIDSGGDTVLQSSAKLGEDAPIEDIKGLCSEILNPSPPGRGMRNPTRPEGIPPRVIPKPDSQPQPQRDIFDPLRDYGSGDLYGGSGGGNYLGPEAFRRREQNTPSGFIDPSSGRLMPGHPPNARFDPVGPRAGEPDPDAYFGGDGGPGGDFGIGNMGMFGGGGGGGKGNRGGFGGGMGGGMPGMYM
eukprot:TRINITY_DN7283_c0_g1_i2.p1 TRINITY_DN7283_c0_g1~~TRINITY_DN7283_c0_g1_i2.p1  ORF type:complete len:274 (+),score=61.90 TRINITY_DN7283_c0_g1_i2:122-943(+)